MNERIKELAEQAGMVYDPDQGQFDNFDEQKFAELIINDCASVIAKETSQFEISVILCKFSTRAAIDKAAQSGGLKVYTKGIVDKVKKHFGMK
jgi:hypothetical protein